MKRKTWVLAGAAVLAAVTATGVVIATPDAKHATLAEAQPAANTATVETASVKSCNSEIPRFAPSGRTNPHQGL